MSEITNQVVERVGPKGNSLLINGSWYSTFKVPSLNGAKPGDTVSFVFVEKPSGDPAKPYRNITGNVTIVAAGAVAPPALSSSYAASGASAGAGYKGEWVFPVPMDNYQRSVLRRDAVRDAVALIAAQTGAKTVDKMLDIAKQIEHYTSGEDIAEALAALSSEVEGK